MLFRPPEYLEDVRERELEMKAMEERLSLRNSQCPVCRATVEPSFLVCPVCKATVELKADQSGLKCVECHRVYPIRDDIPVMLVDEAKIEE